MSTVIGIRFKKAGKVYYFSPGDVWPRPGENVVVETTRGQEIGEVVTGAREVPDAQIVSPLKDVLRRATEEDMEHALTNAQREREAFSLCQKKIADHKLEMKLVDVEFTFDNSKILFYFTADGRIDFRELVKDLAAVFKARIELRQIGVRDEAKMIGGLGSCGRQICCGAFLGDFQPVSIKMAKEQNLSLNPTKISGVCGRLMCCLKYEQENYEKVLKKLPRVGKEIVTPDGSGTVQSISVLKEKVNVRMLLPDGTYELREYSVDEVHKPSAVREGAEKKQAEPKEKQEGAQSAENPGQESPKGAAPEERAAAAAERAARHERKREENQAKAEQRARQRPPRKKRPLEESAFGGPVEESAPEEARHERPARTDRPKRTERDARPQRGERPAKPGRDRAENGDNSEKAARPERPNRSREDRQPRKNAGHRPDKPQREAPEGDVRLAVDVPDAFDDTE